jgi:hypothetical protein
LPLTHNRNVHGLVSKFRSVENRIDPMIIQHAAGASHAYGESPLPMRARPESDHARPDPLRMRPCNRCHQLVTRRHADPPHH